MLNNASKLLPNHYNNREDLPKYPDEWLRMARVILCSNNNHNYNYIIVMMMQYVIFAVEDSLMCAIFF